MKLRATPAQRKILSYLDHSDPRMAKTKGLQFKEQERELRDTADITSVGRVFKDGDASTPSDKSLMVLGGTFGVGLAAASVFAPPALLLLTVPAAGFFLKSTLSEVKNIVDRKKYDNSNLNFTGSRTWELQPQAKVTNDINSPLLQEDTAAQPSKADFKEFVEQHQEADKNNVMVLHGHGTPGVQATVGSLKVDHVSKVLKKRLQETGVKTGLVVLDSCQLGNLSVLKALEGTTDYLVASEADIDVAVDRGPHESFNPFSTLAKPAADNRELAHKVVDEAKRMSTLAAYDMERTPALFESLDKLGVLLKEKNDRRQVRRMLDAAKAETKVSTQSRLDPKVVDLGAFCKHVKAKSQNTETKKQAAEVLKQIDSVVTRKKNSGKFEGSSHISFQNPNQMNQKDRNSLMFSGLPEGWKDFLRTQIVQGRRG